MRRPTPLELFLGLGWGAAGVLLVCFIISEDSRAGTSETLDRVFDLNHEIEKKWQLEADEVSHLRQILFNLGYEPEEIHTINYLRTLKSGEEQLP